MSTVHPILIGEQDDPEELHAPIKPVRYRYVMAYLHDEDEKIKNAAGTVTSTVTHKAGEVMYTLPMTTTTYNNTMYSGTEFSGSIYLPNFWLDLMVHQPSNDFERMRHPDRVGGPIGAMFECGNRAIYVMRNEEVVWGGILWSRSYSSGSPTLSITAVSFDAYAYYLLLRRSVVFKSAAKTNVYTIWYAVLRQMLSDFTWSGTNDGRVTVAGEAQSWTVWKSGPKKGKPKKYTFWPWTGITRGTANAAARNYEEAWPHNSPNIELPPAGLKLYNKPSSDNKLPTGGVEIKTTKEFRGYDMNMVGQQLEEWADTSTILTSTGWRFEYRVVCWFDDANQKFRQRYVYGDMSYAANKGPTTDSPTPNGILSRLLGKNTQAMAKSADNKLIFDFPGHISSWSLGESNDGCATRVIATDSADAAAKHTEYAVEKTLLNVPVNNGSKGWPLYDHVESYDVTSSIITTLQSRAKTVLGLLHVGEAAQVNDLAGANGVTQRSSERSTSFQVTLYTTPERPLPKFEIGDWATFAIEDPFYGGKMYLVRRIMGYTVTVVNEQESDYSHEQYELDLTDDTQIELGS
jgi:hypothetical protein